MQSIDIPIVLGSTRIGRQSLKVARFILSTMTVDPRIKTELLDLGDYDFPIMEQRLSEMQTVPPGLQSFSDKLEQADGLVVVSPEYKGGVPIPDSLPVSKVQEHFDEDGQPRDGTWPVKLTRFIDELLFYAKALAEARDVEETESL
jgi:hypothetical protein